MPYLGNFVGGIGSSSESNFSLISLDDGSEGSPSLSYKDDANLGIYSPAQDNLAFVTNGNERLRIDSDGKFLIGSDTIRNVSGANSRSQLQIEGTSTNTSSLSLINNQNSGNSANIRFGKTRGTSTGAVTTVADGDKLGAISFNGADGTDLENDTAKIEAIVNGTVSGNTVPTDITFLTSATNGNSKEERLRITSTGNVGIGTDNPSGELHIYQPTGEATTLKIEGGSPELWFKDVDETPIFRQIINASGWNVQPGTGSVTSPTWTSVALTVDESGNVGIGTDNPSGDLTVSKGGGSTITLQRDDITVASNSLIGQILFRGNDGNGIFETGAEIRAFSDFNHNTGDKATRLEFLTTPDNNATPVERLRITSAGNVGIGTNAPATSLEVASAGATGISSKSSSTQATDTNKALKVRNNSTTDTFNVSYKGQGYFAGSVGIGTNNPATKLTVYSTSADILDREIRIDASGAGSAASGVGLFRIIGNGDAAGKYLIGYNNNHTSQSNELSLKNADGDITLFTGVNNGSLSEKVRITSGGNVGIGTNNPSTKLHVNSTITEVLVDATAGDSVLNLRNAGNTNWSGINFTRERSTGTNVTGGSIWMPSVTANNSALLYIQTQSASAGAGIDGTLTDNNGVRLKLASQPNGVSADSAFSVEMGSSERLRIESDGNIKVTSATQYKGFKLVKADGSTVAQLVGHASDNDEGGLNLWDGGTKKVQILSNGTSYLNGGNVGIGTTNPSYKLEVEGDIKVGEQGTLWFSDTANSIEKIVNTGGTLNLFADSDVHFYESDTNVRKFTVNVNDGQLDLGNNLETTTAQVHFDYHATSYINGSLFGLGTTSPAANLQVEYGTASYSSTTIRIGTTNDLNTDKIYSLGWGDPSTTQMGIGPYSTTRSVFGNRHGLSIHIHGNDEFSVRSTGFNKLFAVEGGTGRGYFQGNVGIGTNNPQQSLDIDSTAPNIRFTDTVDGYSEIDGNAAELKFNADKGNAKADSKITFFVDNTEKVRITSGFGGNLLVGMDTVTNVNATAHFRNGINIVHDNSNEIANATAAGQPIGSILFTDARPGRYAEIECGVDGTPGTNDYPGRLVFRTTPDGGNNTVERMRIDSDGNVGIGATSPGHKLHVVGDVRAQGGALILNYAAADNIDHLWHDDTSEYGTPGSFVFNSDTTYKNSTGSTWSNIKVGHVYVNNGNLGTTVGNIQDLARFYANNGNATSIRIQAKRKVVGNNWTSAGYKIFCHTDATEQGYIEFNPHTTTAGDGNYHVAIGSRGNEIIRFKDGGNVGIGTNNPATKLEVVGDITITNGTQNNVIRTNADGQLQFMRNAATNNAVTVTIDDDTGNVGIGTDDPSQNLHVVGNVQINGGVLTSLLTATIADDAYLDVVMPVKGGIFAITSFTTYDTYAQPNGTGLIYYDAGTSKNSSVMVDVSNTLETSNDTATTVGTFTDGKTTIVMANTTGTIRIWNRMNNARQYKITLL